MAAMHNSRIPLEDGFSLIIPIYNEEDILEESVRRMDEYLGGIGWLGNYEILLVPNGCSDSSAELAEALSKKVPSVRAISLKERGLGRAILKGAEEARYEALMFYAADLPFGLDILGRSLEAARSSPRTVIIGSKGHPESAVKRGLARSLFSLTISTLNNLLFGLGVKDTQGSILFYREPVERYGRFLDSPGAFFQTQILLYSKLSGYTLREIPVVLRKEMRGTRFRLFGDGLGYLFRLFRERIRLTLHRGLAKGTKSI